MRIGVSAFAWTATFTERHLSLLPAIKAMGLDAMEIPMFEPGALPLEGIRSVCQKVGLECSVCAILPQGVNPISPDVAVRRNAVAHLKRCVEATAAMGARLLGGPLYSPIGYLPQHRVSLDEWRWSVETFQGLSDHLERYDVQVAIEPVNRSETFFLRTAAEAKRLCDEINSPRVGVTVDTFHANIEEQDLPSAIRIVGGHLKHIHASENDRGLLGKGHVPFAEIVATLRQMKYNGYLMIEGFGYSAEEREGPGWLWAAREISPHTLAADGVCYLRGLLDGTLSEEQPA